MGQGSRQLDDDLAALRRDDRAFRPTLFPAADPATRAALRTLLDEGAIFSVHDTIRGQLAELIDTRHPAADYEASDLERLVDEHLDGRTAEAYGSWVHYPWSGRLVHVLPEDEYRELRSSRNRNKITAEEQAVLRRLRLGVVGLSVGQATAVTLALEEIGGELLLADFDALDLSNMNRLRAGVHAIGVNKAVLTAREIFEIDPYARVQVFPDGIRDDNIDAFLNGQRKLDILFEECDDLSMKIRLRERAKALGIPVLMETSDRGMLDVERFDREPDRPLLHGLVGNLGWREVAGLSAYEKVPIVLRILGAESLSARMAASLVDVETTLKTWPQLASAVTLGGALNADAARRIALGQFTRSGRYYVDLERMVSDREDGSVAGAPADDVAPAPPTQGVTLPELHAPRGTPGIEEMRALVRHAIAAPSGGNCQPWRFELRDRRLHCFHDSERSRSFLDFRHTAAHLAIGAALENLALAAGRMGLRAVPSLFPDPADPLLVAVLELEPRAEPESAEDRLLYEQIGARCTNRRLGARTPFGDERAEALRRTAARAGGRLQLLRRPPALEAIGAVIAEGDRLRLMHEAMHREMMHEIRWTAEEAERTRDGLDVATLELTPTDLAGMRLVSSWKIMATARRIGAGQGLERPSRKAIAAASAVGLLTFPGHDAASWVEGGRAVQRVWLEATRLGLAFQPMTALTYLFARLERGGGEGLSAEEQGELKALRARFLELYEVSADDAELMLFRLAHADPPSARSLRRDVDAVFTVA